jgi:hypothetical protein
MHASCTLVPPYALPTGPCLNVFPFTSLGRSLHSHSMGPLPPCVHVRVCPPNASCLLLQPSNVLLFFCDPAAERQTPIRQTSLSAACTMLQQVPANGPLQLIQRFPRVCGFPVRVLVWTGRYLYALSYGMLPSVGVGVDTIFCRLHRVNTEKFWPSIWGYPETISKFFFCHMADGPHSGDMPL